MRFLPGWKCGSIGALFLLGAQLASTIELDIDSPDSIKKAVKITAAEMVSHYSGDQPGDVPGNLPQPYYWWECGAMFGALIDYWYFTGDKTHNEITIEGMMHQVGPNADFMPPNQTKTEGNDDQAFWGMAAMSAAENKFPNPPKDKPQWLALAQAVFNSQAVRWDTTSCDGGMKWQIFSFNTGYNYKNTISNGCFFNIASRLAVYTGNETYAEHAVKVYDWCDQVGLISDSFQFFDGTDDTLDCERLDHVQWSYNVGVFLLGAANMYNFTDGSSLWKDRLLGMIETMSNVFFVDQVMSETACESNGKCNIDQRSFKAYLSRWMGATMIRAPFTEDLLRPLLETSAEAAAKSCNGGKDGTTCGLKWTEQTFDDLTGVGEQMAATEVMQSLLRKQVPGPVTEDRGGISEGDVAAGTGSDEADVSLDPGDVTTGDRVGAGFLTTIVLICLIAGAGWMIV